MKQNGAAGTVVVNVGVAEMTAAHKESIPKLMAASTVR